MCASSRRTKWILGNVQNNYRNMTDYINRQVESSKPSDPQQRGPDGQKFDDDVAQWRLAERRRCHCQRLRMMQYSFKYWGALSCIHRRTVVQSLNCTRSGMSSQWGLISLCNRRSLTHVRVVTHTTTKINSVEDRAHWYLICVFSPSGLHRLQKYLEQAFSSIICLFSHNRLMIC